MSKKQKLELTWIGKDKSPRLEPRILLEDASRSHHAANRQADGDIFDNRLIFGDNLLALKALEDEFYGQVKCIYIDPPYNTGSAFTHYDDGVEHSTWLSLMRDRLILLKGLLSEDGSIWISIDDNEMAYLRILMDEVFGRSNFICNIIWRKNYAPKSSAKFFSVDHDYIQIYCKNSDYWSPNAMPRSLSQDKIYKNPDNDPRGLWRPDNLSARNPYSLGVYQIKTPGGRLIPGPPSGRYWVISEKSYGSLTKTTESGGGKMAIMFQH